jgi:putative peptidoglycan lipid II flippase
MGYPIRPGWNRQSWRNPVLESLRDEHLPLAASAILSCACVVVDQSVADRLGLGQVSALVYGNKLAAVLLAVFASAVGMAVLPVFTRLAAARERGRLPRSVLVYSGSITLLMAPLTVVLVLFSSALVRAFFEHCAFQSAATQLATRVQRFALLQAPVVIWLAIASRPTTALSANRLLVWMGASALIRDLVLDIVFSRWMAVAGIALATPVVQCVSLGILVWLLPCHEPTLFSGRA